MKLLRPVALALAVATLDRSAPIFSPLFFDVLLITVVVTVLFALRCGDAVVAARVVLLTLSRFASPLPTLVSLWPEMRGKSKLDEDLRERRQIGCYGNLIA